MKALFLSLFFLTGCSGIELDGLNKAFVPSNRGIFEIYVSGIAESNALKKFQILPGTKALSADDLEYKLYAKYIAKALSLAGFEQVTQNAQITVYLNYGVGEPGIGGSKAGINPLLRHGRFCVLEAVDIEKSATAKRLIPVWKTTLVSSGPSDDLRRVFPALAVYAKHFAGKTTDNSEAYEITEDDPQIRAIKAP